MEVSTPLEPGPRTVRIGDAERDGRAGVLAPLLSLALHGAVAVAITLSPSLLRAPPRIDVPEAITVELIVERDAAGRQGRAVALALTTLPATATGPTSLSRPVPAGEELAAAAPAPEMGPAAAVDAPLAPAKEGGDEPATATGPASLSRPVPAGEEFAAAAPAPAIGSAAAVDAPLTPAKEGDDEPATATGPTSLSRPVPADEELAAAAAAQAPAIGPAAAVDAPLTLAKEGDDEPARPSGEIRDAALAPPPRGSPAEITPPVSAAPVAPSSTKLEPVRAALAMLLTPSAAAADPSRTGFVAPEQATVSDLLTAAPPAGDAGPPAGLPTALAPAADGLTPMAAGSRQQITVLAAVAPAGRHVDPVRPAFTPASSVDPTSSGPAALSLSAAPIAPSLPTASPPPSATATPLPVSIRPGEADAAAAVAALLRGFDCTRVQASLDPRDGSVALTGHAPTPLVRDRLTAAVSAVPGVRRVDGGGLGLLGEPYCRVLAFLDRSAVQRSAEQRGDLSSVGAPGAPATRRLTGGDALDLSLSAPDFDSHLYVDYFSADGRVVHLLPSERADNVFQAHAAFRLGQGGRGRTGTVGPPYGVDVVMVVAVSERLFPEPRPVAEDAAGYLAALRERIEAVRASGRPWRSEYAYQVLLTSPPGASAKAPPGRAAR